MSKKSDKQIAEVFNKIPKQAVTVGVQREMREWCVTCGRFEIFKYLKINGQNFFQCVSCGLPKKEK